MYVFFHRKYTRTGVNILAKKSMEWACVFYSDSDTVLLAQDKKAMFHIQLVTIKQVARSRIINSLKGEEVSVQSTE